MQIKILKPGILATIQDLGRKGFRSQGVPVSGAMDILSHRLANMILGNSEELPTIEFTYAAAEFECETDILIAYSGEGAHLHCNGERLNSDCPLFLRKGARVKLINNPDGARTYLAVAGGWDIAQTMGSCSTYITAKIGGMDGHSLMGGQKLKGCTLIRDTTTAILLRTIDEMEFEKRLRIFKPFFVSGQAKTIRVIRGREYDWFDKKATTSFTKDQFLVTLQSNRMGYQLDGVAMERNRHTELLSTAVTQGTIQVNGAGKLILLMADCQTTGGYPRIAQVALVDLPICAQLKPGDAISFKEISHDEAELLYIAQESALKKLNSAIISRL
ncbi:MAG: biotin-dependent carboxyltransferase family protein [Pedobacter sp.]|nr:MAG: biotin-dependent carboxyltransferase family protein [Pedobacter sp.]